MNLRCLLLAALLAPASLTIAADSGFVALFNGKDLTGWDGLKNVWSVRDGAITGETKAESDLTANTFLVWKGGEPANFELRAKFRLTTPNERKWGNSGIQYRSRIVDAEKFIVGGYQADIDSDGKYVGMLYEERGRGILMAPGEKIRVGPVTTGADGKKKAAVEKLGTPTSHADLLAAYKIGEWNELRIVANGNHVQHYINGKLTADVTDDDPAVAPKSGIIALQLHRGPAMIIQFKDVQLKTLP